MHLVGNPRLESARYSGILSQYLSRVLLMLQRMFIIMRSQIHVRKKPLLTRFPQTYRHQRNIVDDVLSYSKLDSSMLALGPKPCEPIRQIANSLKMFQPEMRKQGIKFDYCIDTSYYDVAVNWVMADLARIGQVLVNLVSFVPR